LEIAVVVVVVRINQPRIMMMIFILEECNAVFHRASWLLPFQLPQLFLTIIAPSALVM
jgi:hypothetical protein